MGESEKRLFLLDGMALAYRAYYAFIKNPRVTSSGLNTSPVFGYVNTLLDIISNQSPTHIGVAFDTEEPTRRHVDYKEYKAQREAMPEDLSAALPYIYQVTEAMNIPALTCPGYEADDIIGTLAARAEQTGFVTYMVTPDKDFGQLVTEKVILYRPGRRGGEAEILDLPAILKAWQIKRPEQVVDILGLAGDASDNIPGVPGIGPKTAIKLIAEFDSLENLLKHTDSLKGKLRERLEAHAEQAILSKRLATIDRDVPVKVAWDDLKLRDPDREKVEELFAVLEFQALGRRFLGRGFEIKPQGRGDMSGPSQGELFGESAGEETPEEKTGAMEQPEGLNIETVEHDYKIARTAEERAKLVARLNKAKSFSFDIETTSLDPKEAEIVGIAFALEPRDAVYLPFPVDPSAAAALLKELRPPLENAAIEKVAHNIKFDMSVLRWKGVIVRGPLFDTMLAHILAEPELRHGMDYLARVYLNYSPISLVSLIGEKGKDQKSLREIPVNVVGEYAAEDADVTLQLRPVMAALLKERGVERVFRDVECPLVPALVEMEYNGITLDAGALDAFSSQLEREAEELQARIFELAGMEFNLNSPKQLGHVFFDVMKLLKTPRTTRTGQYSTNERVLQELAGQHEIVRLVLEYRAITKLKSTYVDALPASVFERTGRLHTHFDQLMTSTGRLTSYNPNLQNIPIRTERGQEIRKAFVPRGPDYELLSADYSQIELRIIAELSNDPGMLEAFSGGRDIHADTAARIFGVAIGEVSPEMRRRAKMVNFGIAYGMSAFGLAQRLGTSRTEAGKIIREYFKQYPGIRRYIEETIRFAREKGYVETVVGRRRYIRDIDSRNATARSAAERNAINTPIQGSAADMIKIAMARIHQELTKRNLKTKMLLQVHDELVFDLYKDEKGEVMPMVEHAMKTALPMKVPVVVDMGTGRNWLEAH